MMENNKPKIEDCSIFKDLDEKTLILLYLDKVREVSSLKKGEKIYQEGTEASGIFCIHEGYEKAIKIGSDVTGKSR